MNYQENLSPGLQAFNLSKSINGNAVLNGASFVIDKSVIALTGENGSGKTTLLKALVGIDVADEGRVEVCGIDLDKQPLQAKRLLAYVPAEINVYPFIRGGEFLRFVSAVRGSQSAVQLTYFVDAFRIGNQLNKRFCQMSLGTKYKFMLVAALISQPKVLVMDEPTNALDEDSLSFLQQYLIDCHKKRAVLFASHDIRFIKACTSGIFHLENGVVKVI